MFSIDKTRKEIYNTRIERRRGVYMTELLEENITKDEMEEIKNIVSTLFSLPREDRVIILSNANVLKARNDLEKADKSRKELQNQE